MTFRNRASRRLAPALVVAAFAIAACDAKPTASPLSAATVETIAVDDAIAAVESIDDFNCAPAVPRADDYTWICEGSRQRVVATIHLFAVQVDAPVFGATLHTSAPAGEHPEDAATATASLALELTIATVPEPWRADHMPDGGRTLDVPEAGITASVQPLTALQWYVELYELAGLEPSSPAAS